MKLNLILLLIFCWQWGMAQPFIEQTGLPFANLGISSIELADVDGDTDLDVLLIGTDEEETRIAKLYLNANGSFTEVTDTPFTGVWNGDIAVADVDSDGDPDVLISGIDNADERSLRLYLNENGTFTETADTPFTPVSNGTVTFADVDNDSDPDLLITGEIGFLNGIAKLYLNEGGNFTEVAETPFVGVGFGAVSFADVDTDNDLDVLIVGSNNTGINTATLYINNAGTFTEVADTPFGGVTNGVVAFADVDGNNSPDVIISGFDTSFSPFTRLYTNTRGFFTEVSDVPFDGFAGSSVVFADVDIDNDADLFITGFASSDNSIVPSTKYYTNDAGVFTRSSVTPFTNVRGSLLKVADFNGDASLDVLLTGLTSSMNRIANLYLNERMATSTASAIEEVSAEFLLFPNMTSTKHINIKYVAAVSSRLNLTIIDWNGRLVRQYQSVVGAGEQVLSIDLAGLAMGGYLLQLDDGERQGSRRFFIQ